jgi:hypothetical protein
MLKIVRASVLMMMLACAASAGEIPNSATGLPAPPPPPGIMTQEPTAETDVLTEPTPETRADNFGETLLNLLDSVLALF